MAGRFSAIETLEQLRDMPEWTAETPLRVVTGYHNIATRFFKEKGFKHVVMLSADGALEAAPAMGSADIILDLVSPSARYFPSFSVGATQISIDCLRCDGFIFLFRSALELLCVRTISRSSRAEIFSTVRAFWWQTKSPFLRDQASCR
jgi:hypothetical protein